MDLLFEEKESEPWEGTLGWLCDERSKDDISV
jgi:hypothetical protein